MRLITLRLTNFRQFEGEHVLRLAPEGDRNVTVVFGANGSGKTTLLNAFTWCLYGKTSADFKYPNRLISDGYWAGLGPNESAAAKVLLEFEHNGEHFTLLRTATARKLAGSLDQMPAIEARLIRRTPEGSLDIANPKDFIDTILPERLHHFFFLNGERFEHLLSAEAYDDIEEAIKTLLGIEIIERGIKHLKDVEKKLNAAYQALGSEAEGQILERLAKANDLHDQLTEQLKANESDQRRLADEIAKYDVRLRELEGSKALQSERDELTRRFEALEARKATLITRRLDLLGNKGFLPLALDGAHVVLNKYNDMRERREIPRPVKLQFIEDLLEHGECVCGTDLSQDDAARDRLIAWKERAGRPDLEEAWTRLGARLARWPHEELDEISRSLSEIDADMSTASAEINTTRQRLSELSKLLGNADEEDIRETESARSERVRTREELIGRAAILRRDIKDAGAGISRAEGELRTAEAASKEAKLAKRKVVAVEDARRALEEMRRLRTEDVRADLETRIKSVYGQVVKKQQIPGLSESFELLLQEEVHGTLTPKAMSTGEAQVLTLAFVGGLADLARATHEDSKGNEANPLVSATGGIFPFVGDAIFGTLDTGFREQISRLLPSLAPQVVLLLSKAQADDNVRRELESRIGSVAVVEAQLARSDVESETIILEGREYPYVTAAAGTSDRAAIVPVIEPELIS